MPVDIWKNSKPSQCVVLCAGRGSRMAPHLSERPKVVLDIGGRPAIHYVIDYWRRYTDDFVFVVGYGQDLVIEAVRNEPVKATFVEQKDRKGIAHAILQTKDLIKDRFITVLGDCICSGDFSFPGNMDQGVGVSMTGDQREIRQGYSVEVEKSLVKRVVEKPEKIVNDLCGMGFYFFRRKLFKYIGKTPPSPLRNEVEITDVVQNMINSGERISAVFFRGEYVNMNFPEDLRKAEKLTAGK